MITRLSAAVQWQIIMCAFMLGSLQHPLLANKQPVRLSAITFLMNSATSLADVESNLDLHVVCLNWLTASLAMNSEFTMYRMVFVMHHSKGF